MAELKPCDGKCLEEDGYYYSCLLARAGLCHLVDKSAVDAWNKRS